MTRSEERLRAALRRLAMRYARLRGEVRMLKELEPEVFAALEREAVRGVSCGVCSAQAFYLDADLEPRCGFCIRKG